MKRLAKTFAMAFCAVALPAMAESAGKVYIECSWPASLTEPDSQTVEFYNGSMKVGTVVVRKADGWRAEGNISSPYTSVKAVPIENAKASVSKRDYGCKNFNSLTIGTDYIYARDSESAAKQRLLWNNDRPEASQIEGWNGWQTIKSARTSNALVYCSPADNGAPIWDVANARLPEIDYSSTGYEGYYDGNYHSITVIAHTSGATVEYSATSGSGPWSATNPSYKDIGKKTVYFRITCDGYISASGSEQVNILEKNEIQCTAKGWSGYYDDRSHCIEVTVTTPASGATIMYSEDNRNWRYSNYYYSTGTHTVYYKVTASGYNQRTGSAIVEIKNRDLTCRGIGYTGVYDGHSHAISASVTADRTPTSYTVWYSLDGTTGWRTSNYWYSDKGSYKVYCKATATGYNESNVSYAFVNITEARMSDDFIRDLSNTNYTYTGELPWTDWPGRYRLVWCTNCCCDVGCWWVDFVGEGSLTGTVRKTFRVLPKTASIRSGTKSKTYDGEVLTYNYVDAGGFVSGQGLASWNATGTQTDVGTSPNYFTYSLKENTNPSNYVINVSTGSLSVVAVRPKKLRHPVKLEISGPDMVDVGVEKGYNAWVTYTDGTSNTVSSVWSLSPGEPEARYTSGMPTGSATLLALPKGAGNEQVLSVPYTATFGTGSVTNGLVAWYPFDGSAADDMSIYNKTGYRASSDQVIRVTDRANDAERAYYFYGGADSYVNVADASSLDGVTKAFSISAWVCPVADGALGVLSRGSQLDFAVNVNGTWTFNGKDYLTGRMLTKNAWQLVTLTWNGSTLTAYVDGASAKTFSLGGTLTAATGAALKIGQSGSVKFKGAIDDVRIYNRALNASEIALIRRGADVLDEEAELTVTAEKKVNVNPTTTIPIALDLKTPTGATTANSPDPLTFTTDSTASGGHGWFGQYKVVYGVYDERDYDAAQSGAMSAAGRSRMWTTLNGAGTISFWYKTECEKTYDYLTFKVDGKEVLSRVSGTNEWRWLAYELEGGSHRLEWEYVKDDKTKYGADAAWVDRFVWQKLNKPKKPDGVSSLVEATDGDYDTCVFVKWGEPESSRAVTEYRVSRTDGTGYVVLASNLTARAYTDVTAVPGREYTYKVEAKNSAGWGDCGTDPGYCRVTVKVEPSECRFSNKAVGESFYVEVTSNTLWKLETGASWIHATPTNGGFWVMADKTTFSAARTGQVTVRCGLDPKTEAALKHARTDVLHVTQSASIDVAFAKPYDDWRTELQVTTNGLVNVDAYSPVPVFSPAEAMKISFGWKNQSDVEIGLPMVRFKVFDRENRQVQTWRDSGAGVEWGLAQGAHSTTNCGFWGAGHLRALPPGDYKLEAELDPDNTLDDPDRDNNKALFRFAVKDTALILGEDAFGGESWSNLESVAGSDYAQAPHLATRRVSYTNNFMETIERDMTCVQFGPYVPMNGVNGRTITAKKPVDIVFLIDFTGSMDQCISGLMNNIGAFIDKLLMGDAARGIAPISDLRIKVAGFSDYKSDCTYKNWFLEGEFTADRKKLRDKLEELRSQCYGGGGNAGESAYDALYYVCKGWKTVWDPATPAQPTSYEAYDADEEVANGHLNTFRGIDEAARAVVMFTDEPPHVPLNAPGCSGKTINDVRAVLEEAAINLTIIGDGFYYKNYPDYAANAHWLADLVTNSPTNTMGTDKWTLIETSDGTRGPYTIASFTQDASRLEELAETIYLQTPEEAVIEEPSFTATACGEGTLMFRWANDSIAGDDNTFTFTSEMGTFTRRADGPNPSWDPVVTYKFTDGTHPFRWTYKKIDYLGRISDCGLIADVSWKPNDVYLEIEPIRAYVDCYGTNKTQLVTNDVEVVDGKTTYKTNYVEGAIFRVRSNAAWKVVDCPDWVTPVLGSGTGDGFLKVRAGTAVDFVERFGAIKVVAGDYGLATDNPVDKTVFIEQEGLPLVHNGQVIIHKIDIKPRWPWNSKVDIDFLVQTPAESNTPVRVKLWGLNKEGGSMITNYPAMAKLQECPAKKNVYEGFVYKRDLAKVNTVDTDGMIYITCPTSGLYRFTWDMAQDWTDASAVVRTNVGMTAARLAPWANGGFHTPAFSVRLKAWPENPADSQYAVKEAGNAVRVDMRLSQSADVAADKPSDRIILPGGTILTGMERIGHPYGQVDPVLVDTTDKSLFPSNGWNNLDFVQYLSELYTNRTEFACVINNENVAIEGGMITNDVVWKADKIHVVRDNVFVAKGARLTIEEETIVKICGCTRIYIWENEADYDITTRHNILVKGAYFARGFDEKYGGKTLYVSAPSKTESLSEGENIVLSQVQKGKKCETEEIMRGGCTNRAICRLALSETWLQTNGTVKTTQEKMWKYYSRGQRYGQIIVRPTEPDSAFFGWYDANHQPTANGVLGPSISPTNSVGSKGAVVSVGYVSSTNFFVNPDAIPYSVTEKNPSETKVYALLCPTNWGEGVEGVAPIYTDASHGVVKLNEWEAVYDGLPHRPEITSVRVGEAVVPAANYEWDYGAEYRDGFVTAGVYRVTAKFKSTYSGTPYAEYVIKPRSVSGGEVVFTPEEATYKPVAEGGVAWPTMIVKLKDMVPGEEWTTLDSSDYSFEWLDDEHWPWPGKYRVKLTFNANYEGELIAAYKINSNPYYDFTSPRTSVGTAEGAKAAAKAGGSAKRILYFGSEIPEDAETAYVKSLITDDVPFNEWVIENFVCWTNDVNEAGSPFVKYSEGLASMAYPLICVLNPDDMENPIARTCGFMEKDELRAFLENALSAMASASAAEVEFKPGKGDVTYCGAVISPAEADVVVKYAGEVIPSNKYDVVRFEDSIDVGKYQMALRMKSGVKVGEYSIIGETAAVTYRIVPMEVSDSTPAATLGTLGITLNPAFAVYDGEVHRPEVTSAIPFASRDYGATDWISAGTHTVSVAFDGNYRGVVTKGFKIEQKHVNAEIDLDRYSEEVQEGKAATELKPVVLKVSEASTGYVYAEGMDYDLTFEGGFVSAGTNWVVATFKGNYQGEARRKFIIEGSAAVFEALDDLPPDATPAQVLAALNKFVWVDTSCTVSIRDIDAYNGFKEWTEAVGMDTAKFAPHAYVSYRVSELLDAATNLASVAGMAFEITDISLDETMGGQPCICVTIRLKNGGTAIAFTSRMNDAKAAFAKLVRRASTLGGLAAGTVSANEVEVESVASDRTKARIKVSPPSGNAGFVKIILE